LKQNQRNFLTERLGVRHSNHTFRVLQDKSHLIDFCSNDYLGFAQSSELNQKTLEIAKNHNSQLSRHSGATGSRLISGNSNYLEQLEQKIADFHAAEAGLIFNSGYDANVGLLSSLGLKGDVFISDEYIHASMIDGIRLSNADKIRFRHNDLDDLEANLKQIPNQCNKFICVESIYSMDGDNAPLSSIITLANHYGAQLIVDEAHATGWLGTKGEGAVQVLGIEDKIFARVHTFGKALGTHGAIVLGSKDLRDYLVNFARSFIYTTALPWHSLFAIEAGYQMLENDFWVENQRKLYDLIQYFKTRSESLGIQILPSFSPIQGIVIPDPIKAKEAQLKLEKAGFYVKAIVSPTVPAGKERLRICLHAYNSKDEIETLLLTLLSFKP
jgi:8-amino-7-oxononanoate synthase